MITKASIRYMQNFGTIQEFQRFVSSTEKELSSEIYHELRPHVEQIIRELTQENKPQIEFMSDDYGTYWWAFPTLYDRTADRVIWYEIDQPDKLSWLEGREDDCFRILLCCSYGNSPVGKGKAAAITRYLQDRLMAALPGITPGTRQPDLGTEILIYPLARYINRERLIKPDWIEPVCASVREFTEASCEWILSAVRHYCTENRLIVAYKVVTQSR
jgi:hypothetical protein